MSDQSFEQFCQYGTNAERLAFTPDPNASIQPLYLWKETDTGNTYIYTTTWALLSGGGGATLPATVQGDTLYASGTNTIAALAKTTNRRSLVNTGTTNNPAWDGMQILVASGTIANAAIITLPTTKIDLVAAPGAGFYIQPLWLVLKSDFAAGAYGTVNTTYSQLWAQVGTVLGATLMTVALTNDSTVTPALSQLTVFLGGDSRVSILPSAVVSATGGYVVPLYVDNGGVLVSDTENKPFSLYAFNDSGAVNYTGGNAANELKWVAYYTIEAVP